MNKVLKLASNFKIEATEYASQGNAVLGIRDSGKTFTAMKIAEELLDASIRLVVFDPVGIWRNLRVGKGKHKGYPIIVAGGDGADIKLTPDNAIHIVRAAMKANVSIILDLFDKDLSNKSTWIKIVHDVANMLFLENKDYGLCHLFVEESAEFIPQRIMPQQAKVYASMERIARMGRNSSLGYTIINQRAEEINKAILELCALSLLHKQVGKNSLVSINKWMQALGYDAVNVYSLPKLQQGECMVVDSNSQKLLSKIKILPKHTYHPSPEKGVPPKAAKSTVNISQFILKLNAQLAPKQDKNKKDAGIKTSHVSMDGIKERDRITGELQKKLKEDAATMSKNNYALQKQLDLSLEENKKLKQQITDIIEIANAGDVFIKKIINTKVIPTKAITPKLQDVKSPPPASVMGMVAKVGKTHISNGDAKQFSEANAMPGIQKMIKGVSMYTDGISRGKLAVLCGMSPTSGTYQNYYGQLKKEGIFLDRNGLFIPSPECLHRAAELPSLPTDTEALLDTWFDKLGRNNGTTRILQAVAEDRYEWIDKGEVAAKAGMESGSGTFQNYYGYLRKMGIMEIEKGKFRLSKNFEV